MNTMNTITTSTQYIDFTISASNLAGSLRVIHEGDGWVRAELQPWKGQMVEVRAWSEDHGGLREAIVHAVERLRRTTDAPKVFGNIKGTTRGFVIGDIGDRRFRIGADCVSIADALNFCLAEIGRQENQA